MFCLLILLAVSCFLDPKQPQRIILSVREREAIQEKWGNSRIRLNSLLPISLLIYPPPWICPVGWTGERGAGAADLPGRNVPVLQPWRTHHRLPQAICPRVSYNFFFYIIVILMIIIIFIIFNQYYCWKRNFPMTGLSVCRSVCICYIP